MFTELDYGILTTEYVRTRRYQPRTLRAVAGRYAWRPTCRKPLLAGHQERVPLELFYS